MMSRALLEYGCAEGAMPQMNGKTLFKLAMWHDHTNGCVCVEDFKLLMK